VSPRTGPLPAGFRITLDPDTRQLAEDLWYGGSPARTMRLTAKGRAAWHVLARDPITSSAAGVVARRFTDAGLAHPVPPTPATPLDVTVVIPVRDRAELLGRCLVALGGRYPTVVVDDGSRDRAAVASVAAEHGAVLVRRSVNGGPAAARNTGLAHVKTELVAFVDSDCSPGPDWIDRLAGHFADPAVAAVAPRITALAPDTWAGRYARAAGSLDLGDRPARVVPNTRVAYVPTAALLARRRALETVTRQGEVFDASLRIGEDVDLVWRLHERGWRIRYDPTVQIGHHEPVTWPGLLARRLRYGTSAAPLALRHPGNLAHLVLRPWPALTVAALLAGRPLLSAAALALADRSANRSLRAKGIPADRVPGAIAATAQTWLGIGRYATQFAAPLLLAAMLPGGRNRWARRAAAGSLLLGAPLARWARHRSELDPNRHTPATPTTDQTQPHDQLDPNRHTLATPTTNQTQPHDQLDPIRYTLGAPTTDRTQPHDQLDPIRYMLGALADDIAYGTGVWAGCLAHRTTKPLRPVLGRRTETRDQP